MTDRMLRGLQSDNEMLLDKKYSTVTASEMEGGVEVLSSRQREATPDRQASE